MRQWLQQQKLQRNRIQCKCFFLRNLDDVWDKTLIGSGLSGWFSDYQTVSYAVSGAHALSF